MGFPSHTSPSYLVPGAASLPAGVRAIDTDNRVLTVGDAGASLPPGVSFVYDTQNNAVLSIGAWTADEDVVVTGSHRLLIVASGAVLVNATLHGEAVGRTPGPGGLAYTDCQMVTGSVGCGASSSDVSHAGGGGGFGSQGGYGGKCFSGCGNGLAGGLPFGPSVDEFSAGAAGGDGFMPLVGSSIHSGHGGAGGGAIQISSAIAVVFGTKGAVNVAGGGGGGSSPNGSGAGGGAGGMVFLEAPSVALMPAATLVANGGGGGSGDDVGMGDSVDGTDGRLATTPAPGGVGTYVAGGGAGAAGAGADGGGPAPAGSGTIISNSSPGGGGGAVGRIWLRARAAPSLTGATLSPQPSLDMTL